MYYIPYTLLWLTGQTVIMPLSLVFLVERCLCLLTPVRLQRRRTEALSGNELPIKICIY